VTDLSLVPFVRDFLFRDIIERGRLSIRPLTRAFKLLESKLARKCFFGMGRLPALKLLKIIAESPGGGTLQTMRFLASGFAQNRFKCETHSRDPDPSRDFRPHSALSAYRPYRYDLRPEEEGKLLSKIFHQEFWESLKKRNRVSFHETLSVSNAASDI